MRMPSPQRTSPIPEPSAAPPSPSEEQHPPEPNQFVEPERPYGICEYRRMGKLASVVLTVLNISTWVPPATFGAFHDAGSLARYHCSSLWGVPTAACSCAALAATVEIDGQMKWHANRAFYLGGARYIGRVEPASRRSILQGKPFHIENENLSESVQVHRASPDWRTVLYLTGTTDYPAPPDHRYTNGDVPYSQFIVITNPAQWWARITGVQVLHYPGNTENVIAQVIDIDAQHGNVLGICPRRFATCAWRHVKWASQTCGDGGPILSQ
jgi:hypothetical protein